MFSMFLNITEVNTRNSQKLVTKKIQVSKGYEFKLICGNVQIFLHRLVIQAEYQKQKLLKY